MPTPLSFSLGPDVRWSCEEVERAAQEREATLRVTDAARQAMERAREALRELRAADAPVYGVTTGFGPLVDYDSAEEGPSAHGAGLLAHLATGAGPLASPQAVRAMMAARLQSLAQGHSALTIDTFRAVIALFESGLIPAVPTIGSVGASGDLTPLAHVARVLTGKGRVRTESGAETEPAPTALRRVGLEPCALDGRDALGLVNGTSFMTGYAALTVARTERLVQRAEQLTGWAYRLLGAPRQALDARLHTARGHAGQVASAEAIRAEANRDGPVEHADRPLQEPYSLRCAPQVLGAVRDQLSYVRRTVTTEINGVNDNPVIDPEAPAALHGGNFQGQQIAFAADAANAALTQVAVLAERQVDLLLTPARNGGAPPLLAWTPGATSGLAGAQLTATALVAECRKDAQMTATSSIPTNGDNQDIVSMGALAARTAYRQTERVASILAVLGLALAQLTHLRTNGPADGPAPPPPPWMPDVPPVVQDRALRGEIEALATGWLEKADR